MYLERVTSNQFFLDNNFLRFIVDAANPTALANWQRYLLTSEIPNPSAPADIIVTPFSVLEGLGIAQEEIPSFSASNKGIEPADFALMVHDHALSFAKPSKAIQAKNLQTRYTECLSRCSIEGKKIFESCFASPVQSATYPEQIALGIALDYMLAYQYPKPIFKPVHMVFWLQLVEQWKQGGEYPILRLSKKMHDRIPGKLLNKLFSALEKLRFMKNTGLKAHQDFLDLELVHFVTIGKIKSGVRVPVYAHSRDPIEKIKDRVALAKTVFTVIRDKFVENNIDVSVFDSFVPGFVHCYDPVDNKPTGSFSVADIKSL